MRNITASLFQMCLLFAHKAWIRYIRLGWNKQSGLFARSINNNKNIITLSADIMRLFSFITDDMSKSCFVSDAPIILTWPGLQILD